MANTSSTYCCPSCRLSTVTNTNLTSLGKETPHVLTPPPTALHYTLCQQRVPVEQVWQGAQHLHWPGCCGGCPP